MIISLARQSYYYSSYRPCSKLILSKTYSNKFMTLKSLPNSSSKYCVTCGRIISCNHRNFEERKYCSKSCRGSKPSALDRELEQHFKEQALMNGQVTCGDVQRFFEDRDDQMDHASSNGRPPSKEPAKWRERVRRAGRRVVVFPDGSGNDFHCVQDGKSVEPSFAKGEWAVTVAQK